MSSLARPRLETRLKSLDDAFLFMLGFTTLVFAILQTVMGGEGAFLVFLPLLISGFLYPFYVGFIRGAIRFDDTGRERLRGWLCFMVAVFYYIGLAPLVLVRDFFPQLQFPAVPVGFIFAVAGVFVVRKVVRWYFSLIEYHASESDLLMLGASAACATALCWFTFFLESYLYYVVVEPQKAIRPPPDLSGLVVAIWFLPAFIMLERVIQNATEANWVLKDFEPVSSTSEEHVPWAVRPLIYFFTGAARCAIIGVRSDKKAAAAYVISVFLTLLTFLPGVIGLGFGLVALFLNLVACWRFLTRPITLH